MNLRTRRSLRRALLSLAAVFAALTLPLTAATINVPSTATPTIQSGIDAANPGDTVLVAPGTYYENIDFKGKTITVQSAGFNTGTFAGAVQLGGQADTIIDGGLNGPAVTFASGEGQDTHLNGFTIEHGGGRSGVSIHNAANYVTAGVLIVNAAPSLTSNTITQDNCYGVMIENSSPQMQYNIISHTDATASNQCNYVSLGVGVLIDGEYQTTSAHDPPTLGNNVIEDNTDETTEITTSGGGGIRILHGRAYLAYNVIRNNFSKDIGGGIAIYNTSGLSSYGNIYIRNNLIYGNSSACGSGGIVFAANTALGIDAPVYFIYNNSIVDNTNNNSCGNSPNLNGSQVYLWQDSDRFVFANNIIAGTSDTFSAVYCETMGQNYPEYHLTIFDHNDLYNPQGAGIGGQCLDPTGDAYGNISADPLFTDSAHGDYHITAGSPAIDSGNNAAVAFPDLDLDTVARQQDATNAGYPIVDMGVYEFPGTVEESPTEATITQSAYVVNAGDVLNFTVGLSSMSGTPTGQVTVYQDGKLLTSGTLDLFGNFNFAAQELNPGVHALVGIYPGDGVFTPATTIKTYVVVNGGNPSTMTLASSPNPSNSGQFVTFTATLTAASGVPTGTVIFTDGATTLSTQTVAGGMAAYTTSTLAAGVHHILATYTPDSTSYLSSTATLTQVVAGALYESKIIFLPGTPNPSAFGQAVTFTVKSASADTSYIPSPIVLAIDNTNNQKVLTTLIPDASGNASFTTTTLPAGLDNITATYAGDSTHAPEQLYQQQDVVGTYATTTTLASSLNPATVGQSVAFTATVTSPDGTPTGLVTFTDGANTLGTQTLVNGVATYTTSSLAIGNHPIVAAYNPGATAFSASTGGVSQVINGISTAITLSVAPTTGPYGTEIVMNSAVSSTDAPVTGGTVTFMDGTSPAYGGVVTISSANQAIAYSTNSLTVGTHSITAVYSGDATHISSTSAPVTVTITAASTTLSLTATPNPALAFQQITLTANFSGAAGTNTGANTITFLRDGAALGTAQTNAQGVATFTASLPAGTYGLTAAFAGSTSLGAAASAPLTEVVNKDTSLTTLSASPNPGYSPGAVNLFASVKPVPASAAGNYALPGGIFTIYDGQTAIATGTAPSVVNVPSASISNFTVGTHILTAVYSGDTNYLSSTSAPVILDILLSDFTLAAGPAITIPTEHHKDLSLTLASRGSFTDDITLSCGPMPPDAYCTFPSNGPLLAAGSTLPITVRIDTDAVYNYLSGADPASGAPAHPRLRNAIAFALMLPVTLLAAARRRHSLRRISRIFASLSIFLIAMTFNGCSGHYPGHTPPGAYSITVTGQGAATHVTHSATVTLIVTE